MSLILNIVLSSISSICTGKGTVQEKVLRHGVVTDLLKERYFDKNNHVYFENFFTTIALMNDLADNSTLAS